MILRESSNKRKKARFMVLTVKLGFVPSPKRSFHGKVKETATRASLKTHALDDLMVNGAWLLF
jgi:hypothetical protein